MKASLLARLEALKAEDSFIIIKVNDEDWELDYIYQTPVNGVEKDTNTIQW